MQSRTPRSWADSLGGLSPDPHERFKVQDILFEVVRARCAQLGLHEGLEFRCLDRDDDYVLVELPSGDLQRVEALYSWFVKVGHVPSAAEATTVAARVDPVAEGVSERNAPVSSSMRSFA